MPTGTLTGTPTGTANPAPSGLASRLPSLTGLRILAALMVFLCHQSLPIPQIMLMRDPSSAREFARWALPAGPIGVGFFFVLSGFVLTWSARERDTARGFWRRRFVKIYPNYVIAWVLAMVIFAASGTPAWLAVTNLLTLHPWVPHFFDYISVDTPSWTLGVEALFYALFPLLVIPLRRISPNRLLAAIGVTIGAIVLIPVLLYAALPSTPSIPIAPVSNVQYWLDYIFPPSRVLDFALGILLARAVQAGRWRDIGVYPALALFVGCYAITPSVPTLYQLRVTCIVPTAFLIAAAATADVEGRFTLFRNKTMVWLGNISFAFYLLHYIVIVKMRSALGHDMYSLPTALLIMAADLAIAIAVSAALYMLIERPLVRRWSAPRRPAPPTVPTLGDRTPTASVV